MTTHKSTVTIEGNSAEIKRETITVPFAIREKGDTSKKLIEQLAEKLDDSNLEKLSKIQTAAVIERIADACKTYNPDNVFIYTGTDADIKYIKDQALKKGEEAELPNYNKSKHRIHYDLPQEQGRLTKQTYYLAEPGQEINGSQNRMDRSEGLAELDRKMNGIMKGKTMFVGFISRGPAGCPVANPALNISSSTWVFDNARILYRNSYDTFDADVADKGYFFTNKHSEGTNTSEDLPEARIFMDLNGNKFEDETTYSIGCTYAGNTLLLKKGHHRFAVNRAVYQNRGKELAEHMFITAIEDKRIPATWIAGAAPSGCGKTTTAMAGTKFIGDDLAQFWISEEGTIRGINPECGIFAIVADSNEEGDPELMKIIRHRDDTEALWSNVLIDDKGIPRYVNDGLEGTPQKGFNHEGDWEFTKMNEKDIPVMVKDGKEIPISHANARVTVHGSDLSNFDEASNEDPNGVDTKVFTYSGRDADTMPPVWVANSIIDGVAIGANIVSAATATEVGASGVKRAPWANLPFNPGLPGDYMDAQIKFFENPKIKETPAMAGLNYFLTHASRGSNGKGLLGEKKDVKVWLKWLALNVHGVIGGIKTPIGTIPKYEDLKELFTAEISKEYSVDLYNMQFSLYIDKIVDRIDLQVDAYGKGANVPQQYFDAMASQKKALLVLKENFGSIVKPEQL